jgi:unsaturated rhamnogalacturonyl hydrolase
MFVYAIRRGIDLGLLGRREYADVAARGYKSLLSFAQVNDRGLVDIYGGGITTYVSVRRVVNAKEVVGGFLWVAAIMEEARLEKLRRPRP